MATTDIPSADLGYMAFAILKELVSDRPSYPANEFSALQAQFPEACTQAGADLKTVLMTASAALCEQEPGFQEKLERRVSQLRPPQMRGEWLDS